MFSSSDGAAADPAVSAEEKDFLASLQLASNGQIHTDVAAALPAIYDELRRLAGGYLRDERAGHTLQPTALVHEAYLRLLDQNQIDPANHAQLVGMAARMMRRILINHALARTAAKRGGEDVVRLTLDDALDFYEERDLGVQAVDEALRDLEKLDPQQAKIVELRFFGGLTIEEVAHALAISVARVKREWATAKLWLKLRLSDAA
ncbi:MAG: ECF-type sigma factor [Verrucomicrobiota bacterium]|nr:ECF-type sigma factor [Verrucomicrobiota bacterium]